MLTEIKQILSQWMMEIKTFFVLGIANFSFWYVANASEIITTFTQLISFATLVLLFFYHISNRTKIKLETKNLELELRIKQSKLDKLDKE